MKAGYEPQFVRVPLPNDAELTNLRSFLISFSMLIFIVLSPQGGTIYVVRSRAVHVYLRPHAYEKTKTVSYVGY